MERFFTRPALLIALQNFYSGLPLALTASTLTAWLAEAKIDRATIGLFAAVATPYAFKFLWSPLVDGARLPLLARLGRRRSWLLFSQALVTLAILAMGFGNPAVNAGLTALMALLVATFSATQDIAVDAYRVERLPQEQQATGAAMAIFGYRIGMLVSGAGALALADQLGWQGTYVAMAALMGTGMLVTLAAKEPQGNSLPLTGRVGEGPGETTFVPDNGPHLTSPLEGEGFARGTTAGWLREFVLDPFADFMTRPMWLGVLAFVVLYKLSDAFMGTMFNPFLLDLGFTKTQIAEVVKIYGLAATLIGSFGGGWVVARIGVYRTLLVCGLLHMLTNLLLVALASRGADMGFLTLSIVLENFTSGMAGVAFIAYLSALTRTHYTATQYALLSSLAAFGRTWLSTPSGALAAHFGWAPFFLFASMLAIPGLLLLVWLESRKRAAG